MGFRRDLQNDGAGKRPRLVFGKVSGPRIHAGSSCMVRYPVTEGPYCFGQKVHSGMLKFFYNIHFLFFFNWRKVALQCYVGFCCIIPPVSHNHILISNGKKKPNRTFG